MTDHRSPARHVLALLTGLLLVLAACGDDGTTATGQVPGAATEAARDTGDATVGGSGHWAALELCALSDEATVGELFPDANVVEQTGLDDPDWSVCNWNDADADQLSPESTLVTVSNNDYDGSGFADSATVLDLPGADEAVFFEDFDGSDNALIATVGDQSLTVNTDVGLAGAQEFAEQVAATWIEAQNAG